MTGFYNGLKAAGFLYFSALLQSSAAYHLDIFGVRPDFLLLSGMLLPLFFRPKGGAVIGMFSGLLHGWVTGVSLTVYAIIRMLAGYGLSIFGRSGYDIDLRAACTVVAIGSLLTQIIIVVVAPPPDKLGFIRATIGTALYNGVLAIPVFALARRFLQPQDD